LKEEKPGFSILGYSTKQITIIVTSLIVILAMAYIAFYGYNLDQIQEQIFNIPWGLDVVGYTYFALMATGSSIVNSVYTIFGYKGEKGEYTKMIKYGVWFSLATIFPAWLMVLLSLAKPFDFVYILLFHRISSRITWMALLYTFFALMLVIELLYMVLSESFDRFKQLKYGEFAIGILVLIATVAVHTNLGEVFGSLISMPAWYGPWLALYFILSAVLLGAAGQFIFLLPIFGKNKDIKSFMVKYYNLLFLIGISVYSLDFIWIVISGWYSRETIWPVYYSMLYGSGSFMFWGIEVFLGLIIPIALSTYGVIKRNLTASTLSAVFLLIGGFASKYTLIILPQELRPYVWLTLQISSFTYTPPIGLIIMFAAATILWPAVYVLGLEILPLEENERAKHLWIFK
jgi:Ni/Fe-hydrogenase subunit HybB-like protein